jgi:multiple sugar transport system substrate-binding protein
MENAKKRIALLLTFLMVVTFFAGCGKKVEQTQSAANTEKKESKAQPEEKEQVKLKFSCWDYETSGYDKEIIETFKKMNPDIGIEVLDIAAKEYADKLTVMLAGGEAIDVFYAKDPSSFAGMVLKNQIMPIDELVAKDNLNLEPYGSMMEKLKIDGKLYGLPYRSDYWLLFYNKDLFDQAKIPYPTNDWTWNDFKETSKKLTSGEGNNKIYGSYIQTWASAYFLMGLQKGAGNMVEGSYSMLKDGLELLCDIQLKDKSAADYATNKSMGAHYRGIFEKGNVGMLYMGTWFINALVKDKQDGKHNINWGIVQMPVWEGSNDATIGFTTPVVINSKTKHKDAAWKLAKFIGGKEGAKILAKNLLIPGYMDEEVMKIFNENPDFPKEDQDALKTNNIYLEWPAHKLSGLLGKMVDEEIQMVATGNKTVDAAIADMEKRRKEIMEQNK